MLYRSLIAALACATFAYTANAAPLQVAVLPEDMCALEATNPDHVSTLKLIEASKAPGNELVTAFASCDELKDIAKKKTTSITHYGSVLRQTAAMDLTVDRNAYLASVAKASGQSAEATKAALGTINALTTQSTATVAVALPKGANAVSKGVLHQDPRMVIVGFEQAATTAHTAGMTLIGGHPVSVNLYAPLTDKDAFTNAADAIKPTINRMLRDNK